MIDRCEACPVRAGACLARRLGVRRLCELPGHVEAMADWGADGGPPEAEPCGGCGAEPPLPSPLRVAANFAAAVVAHVAAGARELGADQVAARVARCEACAWFRASDRRCAECGCYIDEKARWAEQACPEQRWIV